MKIFEWTRDLSQPHASILVALASSWEHLYNIYRLHRGGHHFGQPLSKPDLPKWLSYYQNHRLLTDECQEYFSQSLFKNFDTSFVGELYGKTKKLPPDSPIEELFAHLLSVDASKELQDEGPHIFPLGVMFAMFVWLPCMALYGQYPTTMMRKARKGDLDTIRQLVRLDRSAIFDPGISRHIHAWALDYQNIKIKRVGDSFSQGLPDISKKKVKLVWAQYVYDAAIRMGMPLTAPKIRALFDALAQDSGDGMVDTDLAELTDDAFYRALTRDKKPLTKLSHRKDK